MPGAEAGQLREVVRDFLDERAPESEVRRLMGTDPGYDPKTWLRAAEELGLHGLAVPERLGGSEASPVELGVVFEEMGAALYGGPFLASIGLASTVLLELGGEPAERHLTELATGRVIGALAWAGPDPVHSGLSAARHGDRWVLSGTAPVVIDGATADLLLVAADTGEGIGLFAVPADADGLSRERHTTLDSTRSLAALDFAATPAQPLGLDSGESGPVAGALRRATDLAILYLAAEQLGGAARMLAVSVQYARTRVQFGRPIGSFQAIKHRCADMLIEVESARSVVYHGLWTSVHDPANLSVSAALARAVVSDAYQKVASESIQVHGGIGFTWEHPAHLYLKRAKSSQLLFGHPSRHRARLAELLGITFSATPAEPTSPASTRAERDLPPEATALNARITAFLAEHPVPDPADRAADRAFREARFDAGLAVVSFAEGSGGLGLDSSLQSLVEERFTAEGAADHTARNVIGLGMALPTIHAHGTPEQRARYLRPCFSGQEIWCQLFSEPGAGSDLAALATRAVPDGPGDGTGPDTVFVVNGQKIWTSLGHVADWGILVARTDPDRPKHRGLSYFLLDMHSPGVEVRPLRQLTGEAEFNEVYLTDVRVPAANRLGAVGEGWRVAMTTLANERVSLGARPSERGDGPIARAVATFRAAVAERRIVPTPDSSVVQHLMLLWTKAEAARLSNERAAAEVGRTPGPAGSIAKLQMAELNKAIFELCVDLSGEQGLFIDDYTETAPDATAVHGGADLRKSYLRSLANSIEGGTSEILRNILGERVLGLPGEPRTDRDLAWKDLPRS
jgi:alkylation response protein AidB-like acyl-CoA dehydrogenase